MVAVCSHAHLCGATGMAGGAGGARFDGCTVHLLRSSSGRLFCIATSEQVRWCRLVRRVLDVGGTGPRDLVHRFWLGSRRLRPHKHACSGIHVRRFVRCRCSCRCNGIPCRRCMQQQVLAICDGTWPGGSRGRHRDGNDAAFIHRANEEDSSGSAAGEHCSKRKVRTRNGHCRCAPMVRRQLGFNQSATDHRPGNSHSRCYPDQLPASYWETLRQHAQTHGAEACCLESTR
jgi:hypothetical protein